MSLFRVAARAAALLANLFAVVPYQIQIECVSASKCLPERDVHRKCRAIEFVTNSLACLIAVSSDRPEARPAVIAAEYVQPVP